MTRVVMQRTGSPDSDDRELRDVSDKPELWVGVTFGEDDAIGKKMLRDYYAQRRAEELDQVKFAEVAVRRLAAENTRLRALLQAAVDHATDYQPNRDWVWKSRLMLDESRPDANDQV